MATLSAVTSLTKNLLKWLAIGIAAILVILIIYRLYAFIKAQITPPLPPTVAFGKLPAPMFPQSQTDKTLSYSINTVTGALPVFTDRVDVFKIFQPAPQLLALNNSTKKVSAIGFKNSPQQISESLYQWSGTDPNSSLLKKMVYNIFTGDFNLTSAFLSDPQVIAANNLPNQTAAINAAENFLSGMSSTPDDLDLQKTQTFLFSINKGTIIPATSLSSAQIVQVSFFQKDLSGLPIAYPDPKSSTINVFVSGGSNNPQVVKADFFHQNIASESATYPILNAAEAFDNLKKGDAYIASYDGVSKTIAINKVILSYYLSDQNQAYVTPVVVFLGNDGFKAYVPAIKASWIQK